MKVIADTSAWIEHLKKGNQAIIEALESHSLYIHSVVLGELACGQIKKRNEILGDLKILPRAIEVDPFEVLEMVEAHQLYGKGLSWADCQILASALVMDVRLLTFDRALERVTRQLKPGGL